MEQTLHNRIDMTERARKGLAKAVKTAFKLRSQHSGAAGGGGFVGSRRGPADQAIPTPGSPPLAVVKREKRALRRRRTR
jgi:hypothetical protein